MISDPLYNEIMGKLPKGTFMIKEYQYFGECPTFKLPDGTLRFWWNFKLQTRRELYDDLRENWRPASREGQDWFVVNLSSFSQFEKA